MHTIIQQNAPDTRTHDAEPPSIGGFRKPNYDCRDQDDALKLVVYVPGVEAAGVGIEARGPDLTITARKTRFVRVNWQSLNLEGSQWDYRLRLRLGLGFAYAAMQAELNDGVLTITLPKRQGNTAARWPRVA